MSARTRQLSHERLTEVLSYNAASGEFTWTNSRVGKGSGRKRSIAGSPHNHGYITIRIDRKLYLAHRLAWFYMTGEWPSEQIDHINGTRNDNRWMNLRAVSNQVNQQNQRKAQSTNSARLLGVSKNHRRWAASICVDGVKKYLGSFDTPELAHTAYLHAKRSLHAGCTL